MIQGNIYKQNCQILFLYGWLLRVIGCWPLQPLWVTVTQCALNSTIVKVHLTFFLVIVYLHTVHIIIHVVVSFIMYNFQKLSCCPIWCFKITADRFHSLCLAGSLRFMWSWGSFKLLETPPLKSRSCDFFNRQHRLSDLALWLEKKQRCVRAIQKK